MAGAGALAISRLPFYHLIMITFAGVLLVLATAFTAAQEQPPTPIRWAAQQPSAVKAGESVSIQLTAAIDDGWHLYALDPVEGGPIPTRITAGPAPTFVLQEKNIVRSDPKRAHDANFGVETAYYEESTTFGLPISVSKDLKAGERELEVTARFQACNDSICLRPQSVTLKIKIKVNR